jgi:hypothetical protein
MHEAHRQHQAHGMALLYSVMSDAALTLPKDIQPSNKGNAKSKLAGRLGSDYDVSTLNHRDTGST